ncbi:ATP-dependent helicase HrpB [Lentibacter sp. XHP0401]|uniref:ATP-dependent helicase HrpB n=1 Tax=Lentibacter sp. XHP0401 TaxID=2984334 RepID=UPI0021E7AF5E|nr:ATP-dependent helicase HrpB [Lentibacter sp. XHP0401]MCV2893512.1 ATP-dependent helicase HrpB [Lentibacter sp. XHP0401]
MQTLPIHEALPALLAAFNSGTRAVLQAPPGAGKTTVVPLALLQSGNVTGRILMLEPRRLAARSAAEYMAGTLGENVGQTVGYRIRGESKTSKQTRVEVVTEGILTRMLQSDPELSGIGMVIFDEFHERSLNADLGLALCLEISDALRDDLKLLVMSATLDAAPVAELMGAAPVVTSEGRSFPVETRWLEKPLSKGARIAEAMAAQILAVLPETEGGVLAFLPGEGEIRRAAALLEKGVPEGTAVHMLFGALPFKDQQAAIRPAKSGRKIVLATSIAETSLTIEDVRVVLDAGLARRARYDAGSGLSRLVTEKVSRAEATQRQGRAGRVAKGTCYRLWTRGEEGALPAFAPAEIEVADLAPFALELALWGSADLPLLTAPPEGTLAEARSLLLALGALDQEHRITPHGRVLAALPVHPRLGHMLALAGKNAANIAALLSERDILKAAPADLSLRLKALENPHAVPHQINHAALAQVRQEAKRLARTAPDTASRLTPAQMAAQAYPDRIALRRAGDAPRFLTSGGKGTYISDEDPLASARLLVVTDTDGHPREARIRAALQISESELREVFADDITWQTSCHWSRRERRVLAAEEERFGQIALQSRKWNDAPEEAISTAMCEGVRELGLKPSPAAERLRARVALMSQAGHDMPDMSDDALLGTLETWLAPYITGIKTDTQWKAFDIHAPLQALLTYEQTQLLAQHAPAHFTTPLGRQIPIDYSGEDPEISLRIQEMFGQKTHPTVAGKPLRVTLLSPAQRPVQTTMDIPAFWDTSYSDVRKDMRGRYPRHPWPEDPRKADPTLRTKRRS